MYGFYVKLELQLKLLSMVWHFPQRMVGEDAFTIFILYFYPVQFLSYSSPVSVSPRKILMGTWGHCIQDKFRMLQVPWAYMRVFCQDEVRTWDSLCLLQCSIFWVAGSKKKVVNSIFKQILFNSVVIHMGWRITWFSHRSIEN